MLKLIYTLWGMSDDLPAALVGNGAFDVTVNRAQAHNKQIESLPPLPDAVVSFWLNNANHRHAAEAAMAQHAENYAGYFATESRPLNAPAPSDWFTQIAFLKKPDEIERQHWLRIWLDEHTQIAIDTQSTFYYTQNIVTRCLHDGAPVWDAIIEERFPIEALTDDHVFFDAKSDAALDANRKAMMQSCARFIDFRAINVLITNTNIVS